MDLRNIKLDYTAKPLLRELAQSANCQYVNIEGKHIYFQTGSYSTGFYEYKLLACDLTLENLKLMIKIGIIRK